jgi:hypothetical protein
MCFIRTMREGEGGFRLPSIAFGHRVLKPTRNAAGFEKGGRASKLAHENKLWVELWA